MALSIVVMAADAAVDEEVVDIAIPVMDSAPVAELVLLSATVNVSPLLMPIWNLTLVFTVTPIPFQVVLDAIVAIWVVKALNSVCK